MSTVKTANIEVYAQKRVTATFDRATNTLTLSRRDKTLVTFDNQKIDSGALAGYAPNGHVVLPLNSEKFPHIGMHLAAAKIVELFDDSAFSTYGGLRYVVARVLID